MSKRILVVEDQEDNRQIIRDMLAVPRGNRNGNFKMGVYTREAKAIRGAMRAKVREIKTLIEAASGR